MTAKRAFTVLIISAGAVFLSGGILSAVTAVIWPTRTPAWTLRAWSVTWLAGLLLIGAAGVTYLLNRRRERAS